MPRTTIPTELVTLTGVAHTYTAADVANGMDFVNTGQEHLFVKNGSGSSITVTVTSVPDTFGRTGDVVVTVPASGERIIGPFPQQLFSQPDSFKVNFTVSSATSVTVAVVN